MNSNRLAIALLVAVFAAIAVGPLFVPSRIPSKLAHTVPDFGAYWSATRVARAGENAYDEAKLAPLQAPIDPEFPTLMTWAPPWAFALVTPWSLLDFPEARWLWMLFQLIAIVLAATLLWRVYDGDANHVHGAWVFAFTFYPTLQLVSLGQMSVFTLLAMTGFLYFQKIGWRFASGFGFCLTLVKPHNVLIFAIAFVIWCLMRRRWREFFGALTGVLLLTAIAVALFPNLFFMYRETMADRPPNMYMSPTVGTVLRIVFGPDRFWLSFVAVVLLGIAVALLTIGRLRKPETDWDWNWPVLTPWLLFGSVLASPYGWVYDQVVLVVPLLAIASRPLKRGSLWLLVHFTLTGICIAIYAAGGQEFHLLWLAPVYFILFVIADRLNPRP